MTQRRHRVRDAEPVHCDIDIGVTEAQPKAASIDWAFLVPILILAGGGAAGIIAGEIRDARIAREVAEKQKALRVELESKKEREAGYKIPYDLKNPDWLQVLPPELNEVSAFAVNEEGEGGWAVNDELGNLYPFALVEGLMGKPVAFADRGDYEGLEIVGDEVVVARSDGTLFRVRQGKVTEVETLLDYDYDVEGLALDGARSRLLVACKRKAGPGNAFKRQRAIYALSLPDFVWNEFPVYTITFTDLRKFIKETDVEGLKGSDARLFKPSAIAVSPDDQYIYILSSVGKMIVVLDLEGTIVAVEHLPRRPHRQPEGMAFDGQGSLYITNEGRDRAGTLYRFDPKDHEDSDLELEEDEAS